MNEKALVAISFLRTAELGGKEVRDVRLNSVLWGKCRAGLGCASEHKLLLLWGWLPKCLVPLSKCL